MCKTVLNFYDGSMLISTMYAEDVKEITPDWDGTAQPGDLIQDENGAKLRIMEMEYNFPETDDQDLVVNFKIMRL